MILRLSARASSVLAVLLCVSVCVVWASARGQDQKPKPKGHPKVTVRANPALGVAPLRVVATAELEGGADDDPQYYCLKVVWRWGDASESTTEADCEPYAPGKSEIKRHFAVEHRYKEPGRFELSVLFKQGDKEIASGRVTINVQGEAATAPVSATPPAPRRH